MPKRSTYTAPPELEGKPHYTLRAHPDLPSIVRRMVPIAYRVAGTRPTQGSVVLVALYRLAVYLRDHARLSAHRVQSRRDAAALDSVLADLERMLSPSTIETDDSAPEKSSGR